MNGITEYAENRLPKSRGTRRYERRRDGYKQLLKDLQDSKLHVFKIRGGNTSIFDENVVKDAVKTKHVAAPIVVEDQFKTNY